MCLGGSLNKRPRIRAHPPHITEGFCGFLFIELFSVICVYSEIELQHWAHCIATLQGTVPRLCPDNLTILLPYCLNAMSTQGLISQIKLRPHLHGHQFSLQMRQRYRLSPLTPTDHTACDFFLTCQVSTADVL